MVNHIRKLKSYLDRVCFIASARVVLRLVLKPLLTGAAFTILSTLGVADARAGDPLSIVTAIGITRVAGGAMRQPNQDAIYPPSIGAIDVSPDGQWVAWVQAKGELSSNTREYTLVRTRASDFIAYVASHRPPPITSLLVFRTGHSADAIRYVIWRPDSHSVAFIGTRLETDDISQIYVFDMNARSLRQITHQTGEIQSFALDDSGDNAIFSASIQTDWTERNHNGFVVGADQTRSYILGGTTYLNPTPSQDLEGNDRRFFVTTTLRGDAEPIQLSFGHPSSHPVTIAPDGRHALVLAQGPAPQRWTVARYPEGVSTNWAGGAAHDEALGESLPRAAQLFVVDLQTLRAEPLVDAPAPAGGMTISYEHNEALVTGAYLPNGDVSTAASRGSLRVDLSTGQVRAVDATTPNPDEPRLEIRRFEDPQLGPALWIHDTANGRSANLPLNPELPSSVHGTIRDAAWSDANGRGWHGSLLMPAGYHSTVRYPLLIQLNGNSATEMGLTLDGGGMTSHPGRLMADHGVIVLQTDCQGEEATDLQASTTCLDAAVDTLDHQGIIDPERVALVGFSNGGYKVLHAVTFGQHRYAAGIIVDSSQSTPWAYLMYYGAPNMLEWDRNPNHLTNTIFDDGPPMIGDQFFGQGVTRWMERSPTFHLDRVRTPLYFEQHSVDAPCLCWDTYAILKRAHRPVELRVFPLGDHNLEMPLEQFRSRQAIMDWLLFWLKGEERTAPTAGSPETTAEVAQQYQRWRQLREEHEAHLRASTLRQ